MLQMTTTQTRFPAFLTMAVGAVAIILAGAIFKLRPETLGASVIVVGTTVIFIWFRNSRPSQQPPKSLAKPLVGVGALSTLATILVLIRCAVNGWHWWCALAVFPGYLATFCFRYIWAAGESERAAQAKEHSGHA
jgi:F0F1-type ATP synthase assembly protein I